MWIPVLENSLWKWKFPAGFVICFPWDCVRMGHKSGTYVLFWVSLTQVKHKKGLAGYQWSNADLWIWAPCTSSQQTDFDCSANSSLLNSKVVGVAAQPELRTATSDFLYYPDPISGRDLEVTTSAMSTDYPNQCPFFSVTDIVILFSQVGCLSFQVWNKQNTTVSLAFPLVCHLTFLFSFFF